MWSLIATLAEFILPWLFPKSSGMSALELEVKEQQAALEAKDHEIEVMGAPDRDKSAVIIELRQHQPDK